MAKEEKEKTEKKEKVDLKNPTGLKELDAILAQLSKDFGEDMSGEDYGNVSFTTSGSLKLDCALSTGGIPNGRIIELIGANGSMKTSLGLKFIGERQAWRKANGITNKRDLILDLEHSLERSFIEGFGVDLSQVIWKRLDTSDQALQFLIDVIKSEVIDYVLVDSVGAMQTEKMMRKSVGEADVGGIAKEMQFALRQLTKLVANHNVTLIFINQVTMNPSPYAVGGPETTQGGNALGYYARLRLKIKKKDDGCADLPNTALLKINVLKTSFSGPVEEIELAFQYGKGFNQIYDIESLAKDFEILKHSVGQSKVRWTADSDWVPLLEGIEKGKEAGQQALRENPKLLERLKHACLRIAKVPGARPDSDFL